MRFLFWILVLIFFNFSLLVNGALAQQDPTNTVCNEKSSIAWEMNTETDLDHYSVYMKSTPIPDDDTTGTTVEIVPHDPDSIVDGEVQYKLVLANEGDLFMRVSATDEKKNESPLSNEVGCLVDFSPSAPTIMLKFTKAPPAPPQ